MFESLTDKLQGATPIFDCRFSIVDSGSVVLGSGVVRV
jgi:hypothetical protein